MMLKKLVFCAILIGVCLLFIKPVRYADLKAGAASVVITPNENLWMSGYVSRNKPAEGKFQDLFAKALAFEDKNGTKCVIVTMDLIGITPVLTEKVVKRVSEKTGLTQEAIMLTTSHTHSGPVVRDNLEIMYELSKDQWQKIINYTQDLEDRLVKIIIQALDNLAPAKIYRGNGQATFAINRRQYNIDRISIGLNPIGPVDHDVPTIKVEDLDGNIKAILLGYACHNTTLPLYKYCGDYAGWAQEYLDQAYPGAISLFFTGCGADINPNPRRKLEHAKAHGKELGQAVQKVIEQDMIEVNGPIKTAYSMIDLPLTPAPSKEDIQKQIKNDHKYIRLRAQMLMEKLEKDGTISLSTPGVAIWKEFPYHFHGGRSGGRLFSAL